MVADWSKGAILNHTPCGHSASLRFTGKSLLQHFTVRPNEAIEIFELDDAKQHSCALSLAICRVSYRIGASFGEALQKTASTATSRNALHPLTDSSKVAQHAPW